jgi:hypothetical protein
MVRTKKRHRSNQPTTQQATATDMTGDKPTDNNSTAATSNSSKQ